MLSLHERFEPNTQEVAAKVMDGEAILINLANGIYYSMDKVGGFIWEMIENSLDMQGIITAILERYDVDHERVKTDLETLVSELIRENLVKVSTEAQGPKNLPTESVDKKLPYETPQLNRYDDMGDLLALDPPMPVLDDVPPK
jgi:hypothetical protein